jgi:parallel beta-helix repeat protein
MRHAQPTIVFATLALGTVPALLPRSLGQTDGSLDAAIAFLPEEQTLFVRYQGRQWIFNRPVISPWAYQAVGNVYWVAPNGVDTNAGTSQAPFQTISQAIAQAEPGDIVYVQAGTYIENLTITKTGQAAKPIIISCAPGDLGNVIITPAAAYVAANPAGPVIEVGNNAQYVWINGLVIEGPKGRPESPAAEHYSACGIIWTNGAGYGCRATNNVVYNNVHCGLKEMGDGGSNILMEGNVIFANGTTSLDHGIYCPANDCTIDGNIIFNNAGWGIHAYSAPQRLQIYRNIATGNLGGLLLAGVSCGVYNNVFAYNEYGLMYFRGGCVNNIVENNIAAFNGLADCCWDNGDGLLGDPANNIDDYNCYFPGKASPLLSPGTHEIYADPQFANAAVGDFRHAEGSPCIGSGTPVDLPYRSALLNVGAF